jgi:hypothetical protein
MTKSTPFLQPGNYMKTSSVLNFLSHFPIECMKANQLPKHTGEYNVYFNTEDLKAIMHKDIFKEMECECITHMILAEHCSQL